MKAKGEIQAWPLKNFIGAVSVGVIKGKPVVDICYAEDKDAETDLNVVMTESGDMIEVQGTAEKTPFSQKELLQMVRLAQKSIKRIIQAQKKIIGPLPQS